MFIAIVVLVVLSVLVALPLTELVLARQAHAELCGLEVEPETIRTDGSATVFLLMDFVRMEEREVAEREFAERYERGDAISLPPLFASLPANDQRAA